MKSCTQAKIETAFVRFLAAAVLGAIAWFAAPAVSQYFNYEMPVALHVGATALVTLVGWLVTKNLVDFTADCMDVPTALAPAFDERQKKPATTPGGGKKNATTTGDGKGKATADRKPEPPAIKLTTDPVVLPGRNLSVTITPNADGTLSVVAIVKGLSNSQFKGNNGLRTRLENIREITWKNPQRQPDGSRRMEGTVAAGANRDQVLARLKALADR